MSNSAGEIIYYIFKKLISILCIKKHFTEQRNYWTSVVNIYNILKRFWDLARPYGVPSLPCSRHIPPWKVTIGCITLLNNIYPHSIMYFFYKIFESKAGFHVFFWNSITCFFCKGILPHWISNMKKVSFWNCSLLALCEPVFKGSCLYPEFHCHTDYWC